MSISIRKLGIFLEELGKKIGKFSKEIVSFKFDLFISIGRLD
jgi:hypothetical protein